MALHGFCAYGKQGENGAGACGTGVITGHHIIPDHCFHYCSGRGKESCVVIDGYTIDDAPVVLVTADANGGKSREHGTIHAVFDPLELKAQLLEDSSNEWTYADARAAAVESVHKCLGLAKADIQKVLDDYFMTNLGMSTSTLLRAGEHGVMKHAPDPRRSKRQKA